MYQDDPDYNPFNGITVQVTANAIYNGAGGYYDEYPAEKTVTCST